MAEARRALIKGDSTEWSLPVLYLRPGAGIIFPPPNGRRPLLQTLVFGLSILVALGVAWLVQRPAEPEPDPAAVAPPTLDPLPTGVELCAAPFEVELVRIEPGRFTMGRSTGGRSNEKPAHEVELTKPFCMSRTEVTEELWSRILEVKPGPLPYLPKLVSWEEAHELARKLNERYPGYTFRLATEAEWEYAAKAGSPSPFAFDVGQLHEHGNCMGTDDGQPGLARVGSYEQNAWGLYDMHGNVFEWVSDWYEDEYPTEPIEDPKGPDEGWRRIRRGGNHMSAPDSCSATARSDVLGGRRQQATGFRLVMEPPPSVPASSSAP